MRLLERISLIAAVVAGALATRTHLAHAQASLFDVPDVGARVRVSRIGAPTMTGSLLARTSDSVAIGLSDGRRESVALKDVSGLEISRGRTRNVVLGTALGMVAGAVTGLQLKKNGERITTGAGFRSTDPSNLYLQAAPSADTTAGNSLWIPLGVVAGTAAGTLVGYVWRERWRPAAIRRGDARVGFVPMADTRRISLVLSERF
jgi:hypothetical protein